MSFTSIDLSTLNYSEPVSEPPKYDTRSMFEKIFASTPFRFYNNIPKDESPPLFTPDSQKRITFEPPSNVDIAATPDLPRPIVENNSGVLWDSIQRSLGYNPSNTAKVAADAANGPTLDDRMKEIGSNNPNIYKWSDFWKESRDNLGNLVTDSLGFLGTVADKVAGVPKKIVGIPDKVAEGFKTVVYSAIALGVLVVMYKGLSIFGKK